MDSPKPVMFDDASHKYWLPEGGLELVSVSQVLSSCDMYGYAKTSANVEAMNFGTHVHKLTHLSDQGLVSSEDITDEKERGHLIAYERFREAVKFSPTINEHPMYHPKFLYAGTADKYGITTIESDFKTLVEIKTGKPHPAHFIQVAGYREMFEANGIHVERVFIVYLDREGGFKIVEPDSHHADFQVFLSAMNVWRWKTRKGLLKRGGSQ